MAESSTESAFKIEVIEEGNAQVVSIQGSLADDATIRSKDTFLLLVDQKPKKIVVDLAGMDYVSSAGIGLLVSVVRRCRQRGITVAFCSPNSEVRDLFKLTHLDQVFEIFDDKATALKNA